MKIVAFTGKMFSGKTTAAQFLVENCGYTRIPFCETLKQMCAAMGLSDEQLYGSEKNTPSTVFCGKTPRYIMQTLGTDWARKMIGEDIWVNLWEINVLKQMQKFESKIVIDDLRFPNEAKMVNRLGGKVLKIVRPLTNDEAVSKHPSEVLMDGILCEELHNDSTMEAFETQLKERFG